MLYIAQIFLFLNIMILQIFIRINAQETKNQERNQALMAVGAKYTPDCIWLMINNSLLSPNIYHTHINFVNDIILNDEAAWASFLAANVFKNEGFCVTFFILSVPSSVLIARIWEVKQMSRYIIVSTSTTEQATKFLSNKAIGYEPNVAVVTSDDSNVDWLIYTRQLFSPSGKMIINIADIWNPKEGFQKYEPVFPDQMKNFYGHELEGVTLDFMPFTDYEVLQSKALKPKPSLDFFILDVISQTLNFTYVMYRPRDGKWGTIGPDGKFQGVVGTVQRGLANFSLVLSLTLARSRVVDFSPMYFNDPMTFVTSTKRPADNWKKLITPFRGEVWAVLCISLAICCVLYYPLLKSGLAKERVTINFNRSVMQLIGSLFAQNLAYLPKNFFGRTFLGIWLIYSLLATTYYKTSLMAVLAVPPIPPTLNTLEELLHSKNEYGMIDAKGSEFEMFSSSKVEVHKELLKNMLFLSSDESMSRVAEGGYAYIYFKSNIENIVDAEYTDKSGFTNLHIAREEFFPGGYAWAFPKGSTIRENFSKVMITMIESGIQKFWLDELRTLSIRVGEKKLQKSSGAKESENGRVVLSLKHLQGSFMALLLGIGFSLLVFLGEIIVYKTSVALKTISSEGFP